MMEAGEGGEQTNRIVASCSAESVGVWIWVRPIGRKGCAGWKSCGGVHTRLLPS